MKRCGWDGHKLASRGPPTRTNFTRTENCFALLVQNRTESERERERVKGRKKKEERVRERMSVSERGREKNNDGKRSRGADHRRLLNLAATNIR